MRKKVIEYRIAVDPTLDCDVRDALRVAAKIRGVSRVTLQQFAREALGRAARECLSSAERDQGSR
jgi:hypothetical protein